MATQSQGSLEAGDGPATERGDGMRFYKRVGAILAVTLLATLMAPPVMAPAGSNNTCWSWKRPEKKFIRRMNRARTTRLISKMRRDPELSKVARVHTRDMARAGTIFHQSSTQLGGRVVGWSLLGENVGVGATSKSLHKAFMNSPAHRENILRDTFNYVGVGTKRRDGRLYVTVVFQAVKNPGTTLSMPRC